MVKPADPFEFMDLLRSDELAGLDRNRILQQLASQIRRDERLKQDLEQGVYREEQSSFWQGVDNLIGRFGAVGLTGIEEESDKQRWRMVNLLLEMASHEGSGEQRSTRSGGRSVEDFLKLFNPEKQLFAGDLLDLGRASYRLRDDDNIALGRVESEVSRGLDEGRARIKAKVPAGVEEFNGGEIVKALRHAGYVPTGKTPAQETTLKSDFKIKARQIVGQPAGPGIATGKARVILDDDKLFDFKAGEVLVCDAIDPNMTFVVPLAAAIVERRGGMLIHGAIIAREYGIPCVTGIPGATELISSGDQITVDGYLGIVVIGQERK
jgi:pyruvate,water dikinase